MFDNLHDQSGPGWTLHHAECVERMNTLAPTTAERALEIGKAAEMIVCADLILKGYRAFLTDQGLPYDVVLDVNGRLLRVQVKSSMMPKPVVNRPGSGPSYQFHVRRAGKGSKRVIPTSTFDILALVALDIKCVAYLTMTDKVLQSINLRIPGNLSSHGNRSRDNIDCFPIDSVLKDLKCSII